jgi:hypothetical protein
VNTSAQNHNIDHKDTSKKLVVVDAKPISKKNEKLLYVIDGKLYYMASVGNRIDAKNILFVEVLKPKAAVKYGDQGKNGVIIIASKKFAINSYQVKLGSFSKEYKTYLAGHQNKDDTFEYEVNGVALDDSYYGNAQKLYKISIESIKRVDFLKNSAYNGFSGKTNIVNILTQN